MGHFPYTSQEQAARDGSDTHAAVAQPAHDIFAHVPRTAQGHFLLHFYAAIHHLLLYIERLEATTGAREISTRYPFLEGYQQELQHVLPPALPPEAAARWWEHTIAQWEAHTAAHLPLRALDHAGFAFHIRLVLLLTGLVEVDSRLGTLFADLQAPLLSRRPCMEIIGQILAGSGSNEALQSCRVALHAGLIEVSGQDAPQAEWALRVPTVLWGVIRGEADTQPAPWCVLHPPAAFPLLNDLIFSADYMRQLQQVPPLLRSAQVGALVLRAMQGSERLNVLGALAREIGRGIVEVRPSASQGEPHLGSSERYWNHIGPLCTLTGCLPVLTFDLAPGETVELPTLAGYEGPVGILMGFEGGLRGPAADQALTLTLPTPGAVERLRHWQQALHGHAVEQIESISERFYLPGGYIRQAARLAITHAAMNGRTAICLEDVQTACRSLNRQALDMLATRMETDSTWAHLVVNHVAALKLRELQQRCQHREQLLEHLGAAFAGNVNRGVRALFSGSSGTGKTLAAKILAAELGMDLYRVDLSAIVNKYIGETEKNLHRLLSRAEELDVILLLDEGDALLGSRTDVKSANDRYANLETNFLLQRLEHYQGIVVITTNANQHIDRAFQRRIDVVVNFVAPQTEERRRIWQLHLPREHTIPGTVLERVATRCVLTGGQIRNAALLASLLALDAGQPMNEHHLAAAIESEYRKAGALNPLHRNERAAQRQDGVNAFVHALTHQHTS
jgi:hypothetical protein